MAREKDRWTLAYQVRNNQIGGAERKEILIEAVDREDAGRKAMVKLGELEEEARFCERKKPMNPRLESSEPISLATVK